MAEAVQKSSKYPEVFASPDSEEITEWKRPTKAFLLVAAIVLVLVSTVDTIMIKMMNRQHVKRSENEDHRTMEAPIWQTLISYILETACLFVFFWDKKKANKAGKTFHNEYLHLHTTSKSFTKPTCPYYYWALPAFMDFVCSLGVNYATVFIHASTQQLLRNINVVVTALISLLWVRVALRVNQWLGVFLVTAGLIITGIQEFFAPETVTQYQGYAYFGVILAIGGTLANAIQVVVEERLFRDYHVSPFESMGYFGLFGLAFSILAYYISELVDWEGDKMSRLLYVMSRNEKGSHIVIITSCVLLFSISTFNLSGMIVTKLGSALLRMIVITFRTFTVWAIELILQWNEFSVTAFIGLLITIIGIAVYNYNYIAEPDSWKYDLILRYPLMKGKYLQDPDELEAASYLAESHANKHDNTADVTTA